jgi:hypothetical protein
VIDAITSNHCNELKPWGEEASSLPFLKNLIEDSIVDIEFAVYCFEHHERCMFCYLIISII